MADWLAETLYEGWGQRFAVKDVLAHERSEFQDIVIFQSVSHGRVLVLDGCIQITEADEFVYQEMLAHVPRMKASFLVAIAANDDERAPGDKDELRAAFAAAKLPAEIEVYPGTMHGWCPPDSKVYYAAQADKAWARMLALFDKALA